MLVLSLFSRLIGSIPKTIGENISCMRKNEKESHERNEPLCLYVYVYISGNALYPS